MNLVVQKKQGRSLVKGWYTELHPHLLVPLHKLQLSLPLFLFIYFSCVIPFPSPPSPKPLFHPPPPASMMVFHLPSHSSHSSLDSPSLGHLSSLHGTKDFSSHWCLSRPSSAIFGWSHGSLHVYSLVGSLDPGSSGVLVGWYCCSSYGAANCFSSFSPFSNSLGTQCPVQSLVTSICRCTCQALIGPLRRQLYQATVSKPLLAFTIVPGFGDCIWDESPGRAVSGWPFLQSLLYTLSPYLLQWVFCSPISEMWGTLMPLKNLSFSLYVIQEIWLVPRLSSTACQWPVSLSTMFIKIGSDFSILKTNEVWVWAYKIDYQRTEETLCWKYLSLSLSLSHTHTHTHTIMWLCFLFLTIIFFFCHLSISPRMTDCVPRAFFHLFAWLILLF
jgi:hypothetical protein